ncbi:hypothetical protein OGATHE_000076 [Ogataea polymorpha]|uniref:Uncharacterized protein n=1 Tax=Ogataea polymorpha TaxID=460523 RepID=A0A9P8PWC5_9ASCO|nr:hypothetical protein OGATHE_000076 [Ogataea polymorpha]
MLELNEFVYEATECCIVMPPDSSWSFELCLINCRQSWLHDNKLSKLVNLVANSYTAFLLNNTPISIADDKIHRNDRFDMEWPSISLAHPPPTSLWSPGNHSSTRSFDVGTGRLA